jgi:hypothetical protein
MRDFAIQPPACQLSHHFLPNFHVIGSMKNLTSRDRLKDAISTSKNRQWTQSIELRQLCVDPVTMLHQYGHHPSFKAL